ncbi:hypothetical protein EDEG_03137 [Edhazardia aedis USNM 41457]|uniref:Uncharacterized protein n=1 Tax=Edhazardia aedis (strain USNM 41457) TaxID=1003232 RepID=J9D4I1_EDHAE|nr:hypothetical protein EDEG_03137 [Edhazardia aedis USNM 41457]|eukprot:EJW02464.1 hypothetical protein EDEG_03137 [Edhazardia aedis USNM 41457]
MFTEYSIYLSYAIVMFSLVAILIIIYFTSKQYKAFKNEMQEIWKQKIEKILKRENDAPLVRFFHFMQINKDYAQAHISYIPKIRSLEFKLFISNDIRVSALRDEYKLVSDRKQKFSESNLELHDSINEGRLIFLILQDKNDLLSTLAELDVLSGRNASALVKIFLKFWFFTDFTRTLHIINEFKTNIEYFQCSFATQNLYTVDYFSKQYRLEIFKTVCESKPNQAQICDEQQKMWYSSFCIKQNTKSLKINEILIILFDTLLNAEWVESN